MVGEAGRFGHPCGGGAQGGEGKPVEAGRALRREDGEDRLSRQFVPELEAVGIGVEHAEREAFVHGIGGASDRREEPGFGARANHSGGFQGGAPGGREPGGTRQHRVAHGWWDAAPATRKHLGHEERVARCLAIEFGRIESLPSASVRTACAERGGRLATVDVRRRGEATEHDPQGMGRANLVVAIGREQEGARRGDAPPEEAEEIERRLVGPMDILEDDQRRRRSSGEHAKEGAEDLIARGTGRELAGDVAVHGVGDVNEWAERAGGRERIADAGEGACGGTESLAKVVTEGGLAYSSLAAEEKETPLPYCRLAQVLSESRDKSIALQQIHWGYSLCKTSG